MNSNIIPIGFREHLQLTSIGINQANISAVMLDRCWRCNIAGHHRRDCKAVISENEAKTIKKESAKAYRQTQPKPSIMKAKANHRLDVLLSQKPCLPRKFLRQHLEIGFQFILEVEYALVDCASLTESNYFSLLADLTALREDFRGKMEYFRDIVLESKRFVRLNDMSEDFVENKIFIESLEDFDTKRQPLYTRCSQLHADLREFSRLIPLTESIVLSVTLELEESAKDERSSLSENLEVEMKRLRSLQSVIQEAKQNIETLAKMGKCPILTDKVHELEKKYENCWKRRVLGQFTELEEQILCSICYDNKTNVALRCGHRMCELCLYKIWDSDRNFCPHCRGTIQGFIKLF